MVSLPSPPPQMIIRSPAQTEEANSRGRSGETGRVHQRSGAGSYASQRPSSTSSPVQTGLTPCPQPPVPLGATLRQVLVTGSNAAVPSGV